VSLNGLQIAKFITKENFVSSVLIHLLPTFGGAVFALWLYWWIPTSANVWNCLLQTWHRYNTSLEWTCVCVTNVSRSENVCWQFFCIHLYTCN